MNTDQIINANSEPTMNEMFVEGYREVKCILVSQPKPTDEKSPYYVLAEKYNLKIDFIPFIQIEQVELKEFKKQKIDIVAIQTLEKKLK